MRFGLYYEIQTPVGRNHHDVYWEVVRQVEAADRLGFDVLTLVEHHGHEQFSISANPLAFFTAVAQRTERLRFRTVVHTLPVHNPIRLAGEIAVADILTNGRLECGVGRGHPWTLLAAGIPLDESRARFEEVLAILELAWTEERVNYDGKYHRIRNQAVVPRPMQKPYPKLFSPIRDSRAAKRGWGVVIPPVYPAPEMIEQIAVYERDCRAHDQTADAVYIRPVYLDTDGDRARREAAPFMRDFFAYNVAPRLTLPPKDELERAGYGMYTTGKLEALARLSLAELIDEGIALVGTPDEITEQIARVGRVPGVTEFSVVANFGGLDHARVLRTIELFARHVIPALKETSLPAVTATSLRPRRSNG